LLDYTEPMKDIKQKIEQAVPQVKLHRQLHEQQDLEILNHAADRLNREMKVILAFQGEAVRDGRKDIRRFAQP
jgi:hypothetical protein